MKSCNLLSLINTIDSTTLKEKYVNNLLGKNTYSYKEQELKSLVQLVKILNLPVLALSNFYFSYQIPNISKEFDLLKFTKNTIINIELKSMVVNEKDILKQLLQNQYYLSLLDWEEKYYFTYIASTNTFYQLVDNELLEVSPEVVKKILLQMTDDFSIQNIDDFFHPSKFLVSPIANPFDFINKKYFLTDQQDFIKREVIRNITETKKVTEELYLIEGRPGTGKTLLLYDLAYTLSNKFKVCLIHCGHQLPGQKVISEQIINLNIISEIDVLSYDFGNNTIIMIDEFQRVSQDTLNFLTKFIIQNKCICIISYDSFQIVSLDVFTKSISSVIKSKDLKVKGKYRLSSKIRVNKALGCFVTALFNKSKRNKSIDYNDIDIIYCDNTQSFELIKEDYLKKDYYFIDYKYEDMKNIIGCEFDNVLMYIDKSFYYDKNILKCFDDVVRTKMLYQGLTRAKTKIALVIIGNVGLLYTILGLIK